MENQEVTQATNPYVIFLIGGQAFNFHTADDLHQQYLDDAKRVFHLFDEMGAKHLIPKSQIVDIVRVTPEQVQKAEEQAKAMVMAEQNGGQFPTTDATPSITEPGA